MVTDREAASVCDDAALGPLIKLALDEFPDVGVVLHSCIRNAAYVATLSQLGVHAVLDKEDVIEHLHAAVLAAHTKANYISPTLADATMANSRAADVKPLSKCEVGVLKGVLSGQSVKQISLARYRSKQTISTHKKNAMRKLQVTTDAELFRIFSEGDFTLVEINCSGAGKQAR
ncbi:helix-turn-helix transcriptional regulator [Caballeronia sp. GaOx3]|uniref:helix-turn-helix transcriptional regulator n=1 Tax=Caballeronia sp. GaOx3 TaxID=2921740 RepID=UPI0020297BF9|nr:LuxR C-terminal-related transcriptional regulator [Caballeronia sp. GaOx3]